MLCRTLDLVGGCEHYNGDIWMTAELFKNWLINLQDP